MLADFSPNRPLCRIQAGSRFLAEPQQPDAELRRLLREQYGIDARRLSRFTLLALLGALPLELSIREMTDAGKPTVVGAPDSRAAEIYRAIARRIAVKIAEKAKDMSGRFPNIVVQNT